MPTNSPITADDEWFRGTDKVLRFTVTDAQGQPQPIPSWALQFALVRLQDQFTVLTRTVGDGITITDGDDGVCEVTIADTDTGSLEGSDWPTYRYELRRTDPGNEDVLAYGTVVLRGEMSIQ